MRINEDYIENINGNELDTVAIENDAIIFQGDDGRSLENILDGYSVIVSIYIVQTTDMYKNGGIKNYLYTLAKNIRETILRTVPVDDLSDFVFSCCDDKLELGMFDEEFLEYYLTNTDYLDRDYSDDTIDVYLNFGIRMKGTYSFSKAFNAINNIWFVVYKKLMNLDCYRKQDFIQYNSNEEEYEVFDFDTSPENNLNDVLNDDPDDDEDNTEYI